MMKFPSVIQSIKSAEYDEYAKKSEVCGLQCHLLERAMLRRDVGYELYKRMLFQFNLINNERMNTLHRYRGFRTGCKLIAYKR